MTPSSNGALQAQLQTLRTTYATRLPEKIARLREICRAALEAEADENEIALTHEARDKAHRLSHNLAGSGATYGYAALGSIARRLELALLECGGEDRIDARQATRLRALFEELENELARIASGANGKTETVPAPRVLAAVPPQDAVAGNDSWRRALQDNSHDDHDNRLIFLASTDAELGKEVAQQIGYFGYDVRSFALDETSASIEQLCRALIRDEPAALLISESLCREEAPSQNKDFHHGVLDLARRVREMRRGSTSPTLPIVFMSYCTDMKTRLEAVRAGGTAYFTHPIEIAEVIDKLDALTAQEIPEPYRVLIVDDEPELSDFFSLTLGEAGLSTRVVNDPLQIITALNDYRPDLILMDVYMPTCSGLELATALRQQEDYVGIPIVFLSAETDVAKQMAAIGTGGDDFLTKPIRPDHLVASVRARAQRSRAVRSFMVRDSLTGLLNHTTTKEQIEIEISRAVRTKTPLSLVMLDIDHFKSVNDTHGHLAGDRVIKNLSRLLQQRLRKTDIIGRYGGEEFAVLLPDTGAETAQRVIDEIRRGFSHIHHGAVVGEFYVTFSAGIASFPECSNAALLSGAADKALYEAKRAGRDRVVISSTMCVEA